LIVAITGHRDLKKEFVKEYKKYICNKLQNIRQEHSNIKLYSALADGADRLLVYEAIKLDIDFIAVLPMQKELYQDDFDTISNLEFEKLLAKADDIVTLPQIKPFNRDIQYELLGQYMSDNSDILFALWDGKYNNLQGGTSEIVKYHMLKDKYTLYHLLVSRENDLTSNMIEFKTYKK